MKRVLLAALALAILASCGISRHRLDSRVDLNAYRYIIYDGSGDSLGVAMDIGSRLEGLGFELLGHDGFDRLSLPERGKTLRFHIRCRPGEWRSRVQVWFTDAVSGKVVYWGDAEFGTGVLEPRRQVLHAAERALERMRGEYEGYSPEAAARLASGRSGIWGETPAEALRPLFAPQEDDRSGGGSGFLLNTGGLVVTSLQAVEPDGRAVVYFPRLDRDFRARVVATDRDGGLAVLRIDNSRPLARLLGPVPYGFPLPEDIRAGQELFIIDYPYPPSSDRDFRLSTGVVSSLSGGSGGPGRMQVFGPVLSGSGGGPVFNRKGEVAGVVIGGPGDTCSFRPAAGVSQPLRCVAQMALVRRLAAQVPGGAEAVSRRADYSGHSLEELCKAFSPFIVQVRVLPQEVRTADTSDAQPLSGREGPFGRPAAAPSLF